MKNEWTEVANGELIETGINSQIRTTLVDQNAGEVNNVIVVRKWARYTKTEEKSNGVLPFFRPTNDGLSFSVDVIPQVIIELQTLYALALNRKNIALDKN